MTRSKLAKVSDLCKFDLLPNWLPIMLNLGANRAAKPLNRYGIYNACSGAAPRPLLCAATEEDAAGVHSGFFRAARKTIIDLRVHKKTASTRKIADGRRMK